VGLQNGRQHWQWKAIDPVDGEVYFMLNTDFELFFDLELNGDGQAVCILDNTCASKHTCGKNGICPKSKTYDQAAAYAQVFNRNFSRMHKIKYLLTVLLYFKSWFAYVHRYVAQ
jgi:hypothetical protein